MKKTFLILIMIIWSTISVFAGKTVNLSVTGNYWIPADEDYKTIYGEGMFYPELQVSFKIYKGLHVWIGYGYLTAEGTIPVVEDYAKSIQHHLSVGAGYILKIYKFINFRIDLGSFNVYYLEKTQNIEETGMAFGIRGDGEIVIFIGKYFFVGLSCGYSIIQKLVNDNSVRFGGFKAGLDLGINF